MIKKEQVLWGCVALTFVVAVFSVWQFVAVKKELFVISSRIDSFDRERALSSQASTNFSAQYSVSGIIRKIETDKWLVDIKVAQAPNETPSKGGAKTSREIAYSIIQSTIIIDKSSFVGKEKQKFIVGDPVVIYSVDPISDVSKIHAAYIESQTEVPQG